MKPYSTLIKLSKTRIDEIRQNMAVFVEKQDALRAENKTMAEQLATERQAVEQHPELSFSYTHFKLNIEIKTENNHKFIDHIEDEIEKLQQKMREEFAEQKKYELMMEAKQAELDELEKQRESFEMDELNINKHFQTSE